MKKYFMMVDLLGFGKIVNTLSEKELGSRIDAWVGLVELLSKKYELNKIQMISDTLFVGTSSNSLDDLRKLVSFGRELLENGLEQSLLLRGAITYGSFTWDKLVYGKAVVKAYESEQNQNWFGIILEFVKDANHDALLREGSLLCYSVPYKRGMFITKSVINWDIPNYESLIKLSHAKGLAAGGDYLMRSVVERTENTYIFKLYKETLIKHGDPTDKFEFLSPLEYIGSKLL